VVFTSPGREAPAAPPMRMTRTKTRAMAKEKQNTPESTKPEKSMGRDPEPESESDAPPSQSQLALQSSSKPKFGTPLCKTPSHPHFLVRINSPDFLCRVVALEDSWKGVSVDPTAPFKLYRVCIKSNRTELRKHIFWQNFYSFPLKIFKVVPIGVDDPVVPDFPVPERPLEVCNP